ncbi:MAG: PilN domain-containing protein [Nitrospiria bacterium]
MIEINLLTPHRAKKVRRKVEIQSQLVVVVAVCTITLLICGYVWGKLNDQVDVLKVETEALSAELAQLKMKVKEVKNYERNKKVVQEKIEVIAQLRKNQSIPVHLLDEISKSLPDRAWITRFGESRGSIELDGRAVTNNDIVEFIDNLKGSSFFGDVQILESRKSVEGGVPVYFFRLKGVIVSLGLNAQG